MSDVYVFVPIQVEDEKQNKNNQEIINAIQSIINKLNEKADK